MANSEKTNNFGFLRLLFAILVILSHSSELVDGNRSREILSVVFGPLTFGGIAVDGFFLISGFLLVQSFENSTLRDYVVKRVLRIYPGFVAAYLVCVFVFGPYSGGDPWSLGRNDWLILFGRIIMLSPPYLDGAFAHLPEPQLNGSVWTIRYEFFCYGLIAALGLLSLLGRRLLMVGLATALLLAMSALRAKLPIFGEYWLQHPSLIHFTALFCCGSAYYRMSDSIPYRPVWAAIAALLLAAFMYSNIFSEMAFAVFGGYLIFWFALHVPTRYLSQVGQNTDISYGVYLYAWPIQNSIIYRHPDISPWLLFVVSTAFAVICGFVSWTIVERRMMALKHRFVARVRPT
jgi:peptidoglycan/LPS O-acetylase OafA/YrhL